MQPIWDKFINILNELDAIRSISTYGYNCQTQTCWPKFVGGKPHLYIKNGKHPQLEHQSLIPNNVDIGVDNENFLLITGPNMGGKSTILRMTCVLTILAQMGFQVPCEQMELTPVDRIFTRIGAKDSLLEQKSTFYIELEETLQPLNFGTQNSLFIADELGRGTSTNDGIAIAFGVMRYIIEKIKCRTMFTTHYKLIVEESKLLGQITNMHMACMTEDDMVVLLYKLKLGECPKSFGINVAKSVGINNQIIQKAQMKSMEYEQNSSVKAQEEVIKDFNILISELLK